MRHPSWEQLSCAAAACSAGFACRLSCALVCRVSEMLEVMERAEEQDPQQAAPADQPSTSDAIIFEQVPCVPHAHQWQRQDSAVPCATGSHRLEPIECTTANLPESMSRGVPTARPVRAVSAASCKAL